MRIRLPVPCFLGLIALTAAMGCNPRPDLGPGPVPARPDLNTLCERDDDGRLLIIVTNQGFAATPTGSTTVVMFDSGENEILDTPVIEGFESFTHPAIDIPSGCFDPECGFTVIVDFDDVKFHKDILVRPLEHRRFWGLCIQIESLPLRPTRKAAAGLGDDVGIPVHSGVGRVFQNPPSQQTFHHGADARTDLQYAEEALRGVLRQYPREAL